MLTGPAPASRKALAKAGVRAEDLDLVEINEAFASVVLRFVRELDLDLEKVNVNGGAIAMGHPLGATGGMILGTLVDELERQDKRLAWRPSASAAAWGSPPWSNGSDEREIGAIRWERDADGVVVLTLDDPARSANTMNRDFQDSLGRAVDRLEAELDEVTGVVIASAKGTFMAGGDLNDLVRIGPDDGDAAEALVATIKEQLRRLETLGRPVVAVVAGAALGGGLEIALAAHRRIVLDDPKVALGLPEVQLGLCPGAGGVVRTVRMLGVQEALLKLLLEGKPLRPGKALELGIVDELVARRGGAAAAGEGLDRGQPRGGAAVGPRGLPDARRHPRRPAPGRQPRRLPGDPAQAAERANYPAPRAIMAAAVEGAQLDFDNALAVENRYFVHLATGQVATNMIQAFFFDMQQVKGDRLPDGRRGAAAGAQRRRAGGGDDGRRDRLRLRRGRDRGGADRRRRRCRRARQGLLRAPAGEGGRARPHRPRRTPMRCWPGSPPRPSPRRRPGRSW